jgi:Peptidase A4 family
MPSKKIGTAEVHTFPLPPKGFDPLQASKDELQRYGFPRRPDEIKETHAASKWVKAFRKYPAFTHITPEFKELPHRHRPNKRTQAETKGNVNATSSNWSGSVLFIGNGDSFSSITGQWTVPHVYSPNPGNGITYYSSVWLGIDGDGSPDVLQAGTECDSDGTCYAWFEWYPNYSALITNFPINPGDIVSLTLCVTSPTSAWMSIGDLTSEIYTNFSFTAPAGTTLVGNCAEAIVERPDVGGELAELPRYGEVYIDETTAYTANGNAFDIGLGTPISMVADDGVTVISTPTFEDNADMISITYTGP